MKMKFLVSGSEYDILQHEYVNIPNSVHMHGKKVKYLLNQN